ncbi:MAG: hypothetical protein IJ776_07830 [Paludibacteraceae bacterium]|nr:hypothetical protein [Paludibacteraceae bacterium]
MKKYSILTLLLLFAAGVFAQTNGELDKYRRNALGEAMVYHSEDTFGVEIYEAFEAIPISDKYDDHNIGLRVVANDSIPNVRRRSRGLVKAQYGKTLTAKDIRLNGEALESVLNNAEIAKFMVAKWFGWNMDSLEYMSPETATFNMRLIQERGQYNASDLDVAIASQTTRGLAAISDAGEELLGNTFFLVNDMTYVTAEERAAAAKTALNILGGIADALLGSDVGSSTAKAAGDIADSFTGFTVKTHSYLYQLQWNDSVAAIFYNKYYTETPDVDKIMAFLMDTSTFRMKYVAHEYEYSGKSTLKGKYERAELVKMSCTRSIDKNIAALQLAYEDFKVKVPVYEIVTNEKGKVLGYSAKIGMKEGITEKSTFQVIQRVVDPQTNRTIYRYVASLKPVKGKIWDNRYNAVLEQAEGSELTATMFKKTAGGEILPGMLIIEGKYRKVQE